MADDSAFGEATRRAFGDIVAEATVELFGAYGVDALPVSETVPYCEIAAVIGVSTGTFRGTATLIGPRSVFGASRPEPASRNDEAEDWARELANQLAGRIAGKLAEFGHVIEIGIPTVVQGHSLSRHRGTGNLQCLLVFRTRAGSFVVAFEGHAEPRFDLSDASRVESANVREGGCLLF